MQDSFFTTMARYFLAIAPVYVAVAIATVVVGVLLVAVIAHPHGAIGFAFGVIAGGMLVISVHRVSSFARGVRTSYSVRMESAHNT